MTAQEAFARAERANETALEVEVQDEDGRIVSLEELRKRAGGKGAT